MSIKLVHAVGDYDGTYGDGDGREITYRKWYDRNGKGWQYFVVCKDQNKANEACSIMKQIAENNRYGYSQQRRLTGAKSIIEYLNKGYNIADAIRRGSGDFDCSSMQSFGYYQVGLLPNYNYNTDSILTALKKSGHFIIVANPKNDDQARVGSLYLAPRSMNGGSGHVAMSINDGVKPYPIDPQPEPVPPIASPYLRILKGSVRVREGESTDYPTRFIAHQGDVFPYLGTAGSGWYIIDTSAVVAGVGYVSCNIPRYVEVVEQ